MPEILPTEQFYDEVAQQHARSFTEFYANQEVEIFGIRGTAAALSNLCPVPAAERSAVASARFIAEILEENGVVLPDRWASFRSAPAETTHEASTTALTNEEKTETKVEYVETPKPLQAETHQATAEPVPDRTGAAIVEHGVRQESEPAPKLVSSERDTLRPQADAIAKAQEVQAIVSEQLYAHESFDRPAFDTVVPQPKLMAIPPKIRESFTEPLAVTLPDNVKTAEAKLEVDSNPQELPSMIFADLEPQEQPDVVDIVHSSQELVTTLVDESEHDTLAQPSMDLPAPVGELHESRLADEVPVASHEQQNSNDVLMDIVVTKIELALREAAPETVERMNVLHGQICQASDRLVDLYMSIEAPTEEIPAIEQMIEVWCSEMLTSMDIVPDETTIRILIRQLLPTLRGTELVIEPVLVDEGLHEFKRPFDFAGLLASITDDIRRRLHAMHLAGLAVQQAAA